MWLMIERLAFESIFKLILLWSTTDQLTTSQLDVVIVVVADNGGYTINYPVHW